MELMNELFTNVSYLKKLLDITASKWGLLAEEHIYVEDKERIQDGFIFDKNTNMLVFRQHIFCMLKPNGQGLTSIHLIHDAQENTIACQAYRGGKPVSNYVFFARQNDLEDEFANYMNLVVGRVV